MCWRQRFAFNSALWHGALFNWQKWFAGIAIKDENEPGLCDLGYDIMEFAISPHRVKPRLCRHIVVPDIMVYGLETPHHFTGITIQGNNGVGGPDPR